MAAEKREGRFSNATAAFQFFEVGKGLEQRAQTGNVPERRDVD